MPSWTSNSSSYCGIQVGTSNINVDPMDSKLEDWLNIEGIAAIFPHRMGVAESEAVPDARNVLRIRGLCNSAGRWGEIAMYNRYFFFCILIFRTFRTESLLSGASNHIENVNEARSPREKFLFEGLPLNLLIEWMI